MLSALEKIMYLRQIELFTELSAKELSVIAQKTTEEGYSKGNIVFRQGDEGDALYFILGGKVRVIREHGKKRETVAILEEFTCFGEMAILGDNIRTATIEAADTITLLKLGKDEFHDMIMKRPDIAFPIFRILVRRLKKSTDMYMAAVKIMRTKEK